MSTSTEAPTAVGFPEDWWDRFENPSGWRAEIIGGELVMSPEPILDHGVVQAELYTMLKPFVPDGARLYLGEWRLVERGLAASAPAPDLMVARKYPRGTKAVIDAPLLTIEVLSPTDVERRADGLTRIAAKRIDYAKYGVKDHLEIEFDSDGSLRLTRYELEHPVGKQIKSITAGNPVAKADRPFPYEIDLAALVRALD